MILEHVMFLNLPANLEPTEVQNKVQLKTSGYVIYWRGAGKGVGSCQGALPLPPDFTDIEILLVPPQIFGPSAASELY